MKKVEVKSPDPYSSSVGAFVLDTLTVGMYTDARDAIREYIQNALDGIRLAAKQGLYRGEHGQIQVQQSSVRNELVIYDNGAGISSLIAAQTLISIGKSTKKIGESAGFRGIGRLAGIAYCDQLIFETSFDGEDIGSRVVFDCNELCSNFDPTKREPTEDLETVMRGSCTVEEFEEIKASHFFRVRMVGLKGEGKKYLEFEHLHEYLCQYAPVDYDSQKFIWASQLREKIEASHFSVPTVDIEIVDGRKRRYPVRKPYRGRHSIRGGASVDILGLEFFSDPSGEERYWGWYSKSDLLGMITDKECAGLRVRIENILVGGPALTEQFFSQDSGSNARFNNYYVGEVFLSPGLFVPNARRDGFEDTQAWRSVRLELEALAKNLSTQVRSNSQDRNKSVAKIKNEVEKLISQTDDQIDQGFTSEADKNNQLTKIDRRIERVEAALTKGRPNDESSEIAVLKDRLSKKRDDVAKVKRYAVSNLQGVLNKRQMAVLRTVYEVLKAELDEKAYDKIKRKIDANLKQPKKQ